jgi:hypothetical protein
VTKDTPVNADSVIEVLSHCRFSFVDEDRLQAGIAAALADVGVSSEREVRLAPRDRIDLLASRVGIEVKVAGSAESAWRQLNRYATSDRVDELVLVTTRASHRALPREVLGKPLSVWFLGGLA